MRPILGLSSVLVLMLVSCQQDAPAPTAPVAPVPNDRPIQIPGLRTTPQDSDDWVKQAHKVSVLTPVDNSAGTKADLSIAWTPEALRIRINSNDTTPFESAVDAWNDDSVEVFLASSPGSDDRIQFICTPGRTLDPPKPAWHVKDERGDGPPVVGPDMYVQKSDSGYSMTISIPWANLKHIPTPNTVIGLQVYVNDAQAGSEVSHRIWFPQNSANDHAESMQSVQLTGLADPPETIAIWLKPKGLSESVQLSAGPEFAGKKIEVWAGDKQVGSGELKAGGADGSRAEVSLSKDLVGQKNISLVVTVDGNVLPGVLKIPDLAKQEVNFLKNLPMAGAPSIFDTASFPKIDFVNKELVEDAIGSYSLHSRFFDANWNEVTVPKAPGRYGAVVDFQSEDGLTFTKYLTLFKTAEPYVAAKDPYIVTVKFPAAFGLSSEAVTREAWNVSNWTDRTLQDQAHNNDGWPVLVAGLHDLQANPGRWHGFTPWAIDNIWWTELRKRLGENQDYPHLTYLPDGYNADPKKTWPLILFLHGSGERGADLSVLKNQGPQGYINRGHPVPFIVISPQCPEDERWDPSRLDRLVDQVAKENRVDPKRIYVTGLSMGGYGSFDLAASYPDKFAAIAPLSGGDTPDAAERLKKMPAWIFHGADDTVVPARYSTDLYQALKKAGAPVTLTLKPGVGHGGWNEIYDDPALYAWFLKHSK